MGDVFFHPDSLLTEFVLFQKLLKNRSTSQRVNGALAWNKDVSKLSKKPFAI